MEKQSFPVMDSKFVTNDEEVLQFTEISRSFCTFSNIRIGYSCSIELSSSELWQGRQRQDHLSLQ